eukprot:g51462.t1
MNRIHINTKVAPVTSQNKLCRSCFSSALLRRIADREGGESPPRMEASPPVLERAMTEHRKWNPIRIGGTVPNFEAESSEGMVDAYKYFGNCWGMLCAHPRKINAVSTSEL